MVREFKEVLWNARNVLPLQDVPDEIKGGERFIVAAGPFRWEDLSK